MNSRFSTAVHILTLLASASEERLTSEYIATSVGTNPVVVRRQLAQLRLKNLVRSKGARGGGWALTRDADRITLREVREALGAEAGFRMHQNEPHPQCIVGQNVRGILELVYSDAEQAVNESLESWTIADMLQQVRNAAGAA